MQCESPEPPPLISAIKPSERKLGFLQSFTPTKETQQSRISMLLE